MRRIFSLIGAGAPRRHGVSRAFAHPTVTPEDGGDHRAIFHTFAAGLARMMRPHRPIARVRTVEA
jgi:hypothetical protein